MAPAFFRTAQLRTWFEQHHDSATELFIGYHKKGSGQGGVTYPQALDEALSFGRRSSTPVA